MKEFRFVHSSGDTFMSLARTRSDIGHLLELRPRPLWLTLTEIGELATIKAIRAEVNKRDAPYSVINPDRGDIAFLVNRSAHVVKMGGRLAIPGKSGPAKDGGHGPRHNSFVELDWADETIFVNGVHLVTFHTNHASNSGDRSAEQVKQLQLLGKQMAWQSKDGSMALGSGDLNGALPNRHDLQKVFDQFNMTTTAHETGDMTGTHGNARIDYAWTMDKDKRLDVVDMKVLKSGVFNTDHDPIVVDCKIH